MLGFSKGHADRRPVSVLGGDNSMLEAQAKNTSALYHVPLQSGLFQSNFSLPGVITLGNLK